MKVLLFANTDWYLYNFCLSLAHALRAEGDDVMLCSPPGPYGEKLQGLGFRWITAPMDRRSLNPMRELALIVWLSRLLRSERVDIVHGFTIKCSIYGSLGARVAQTQSRVNSISGLGYVFTNRDLKARLLRPVVWSLMKLAFRGANSRLIVQNTDDVSFVERSGVIDPRNVRLVPGSGVNCERFAPPSLEHRRPQRPEPLRVLLAARLLWDKGVAEYIAAARSLKGQGRSIDFLLAGEPDEGNPAAVPTETVRRWGEEGLVTRLGHVEDMPDLLRSVDIAVLPSYREGLPKGLLEAAACELPIVTTDAPGCRHVVTDNVEGLVVPCRDSAALAQAIARLHDAPELRLRLGANARARVLKEFDEAVIHRQIVEIYREFGAR